MYKHLTDTEIEEQQKGLCQEADSLQKELARRREEKGRASQVDPYGGGVIGGKAYVGGEPLARLVDTIFSYHAPFADQLPKFQAIRQAAKNFAQVVIDNTPNCADRTTALRLVREAVMWANASIVLDGKSF